MNSLGGEKKESANYGLFVLLVNDEQLSGNVGGILCHTDTWEKS